MRASVPHRVSPLTVLCLLCLPPPTTRRRRTSLSYSTVEVQRVRSILLPQDQASLFAWQARPDDWPNRVSHRADVTFASRCSPPPFSRTQLRSTTARSANRSGEDFHLLDIEPSRAHHAARGDARPPDRRNGVHHTCAWWKADAPDPRLCASRAPALEGAAPSAPDAGGLANDVRSGDRAGMGRPTPPEPRAIHDPTVS